MTSDLMQMRVSVALQQFSIEARCQCGAPLAGHHHVGGADLDIAHLVPFFTGAFERHVADAAAEESANHDGVAHRMDIRVVNPVISTTLIEGDN